MPWKVSDVKEQRFRLIERWKETGESVAELARRFEVSRKTIYKWLDRYELSGLDGLEDRSREPHAQGRRTPAESEQWIVDLRRANPRWGAWKLREVLRRKRPELTLPAESTIGLILKRHGLNGRPVRHRRTPPYPGPLAHAREANDVWAIDFKGWFLTGDGQRCDPLTVSDQASRYLLCCRSLWQTNTSCVRRELERIFRAYGLPRRMRSDNGSPFASTAPGGLTTLSVWWVRLGIVPERIEPGEPQQNGRHERMHLTLKQETAAPPAQSRAAQQQRFAEFLRKYNEERPHEALGGDTPAERYQRSAREYPEKLAELEYPCGLQLRKVDHDGRFRWKQARCRAGGALAHQVVALEAVDDDVWRVWFGPVPLGLLHERKGHSATVKKENSHWPTLRLPADHRKVSPM